MHKKRAHTISHGSPVSKFEFQATSVLHCLLRLAHNVPNVIIPVLVFELTVSAAMEVGGSVCVVRIPSSNELKLSNQSVGR